MRAERRKQTAANSPEVVLMAGYPSEAGPAAGCQLTWFPGYGSNPQG